MIKSLEALYELEERLCIEGCLDYINKERILDIKSALKVLETIKHKLERWLELLQTDGINSKSIVMNDIQYLLKEED